MPLATHDIDLVRDIVRRRTGNVWSEAQGYLIESRLRDVAEASGFETVEELVAELRRSPARHEAKVAEGVTVNETRFFRDTDLFQALEKDVLPELIASRQAEKRLNILSAACSTGQEPYSLAMLMAEKFPQLSDWNVRITACDINDAVVQKARSATYSQFEVNRGLPMRMLVKYFDRNGVDWCVKPEIRNIVHVLKLNLMDPLPVFGVDLLLVRNVLIYFDESNKQAILKRLHRAMRPDGMLLLGGGETLIGVDAPFTSGAAGGVTVYRPTQNTSPAAMPTSDSRTPSHPTTLHGARS